MFFRGEEKAARRDKIEPLRRRGDEDKHRSAGERQRLLARPQSVDLVLRAGDEAAAKIEPELRQPLRIRSAMLGEGAFRRGEEEEIVPRPLREGECEGERRHLLPRRGRRRFYKAKPGAGAKGLKGWRVRKREAENGGGGDHEKS